MMPRWGPERRLPARMRVLNVIQKYLSLWVALTIGAALSAGYTFPGIAVLKAAIPFLLFAMLYPMMIQLRLEDITKAGRNLKLAGVAVFMNFLVAPLLGAIWTHFLFRHTDPYLAVGFILKVTVPCSGMVGVLVLPVRRQHNTRAEAAKRFDQALAKRVVVVQVAVRQPQVDPGVGAQQPVGRGRFTLTFGRTATRAHLATRTVNNGHGKAGLLGFQQ